jgi:hypothetical protein
MELENMARSKHEGNFSSDDAFNFIAQMIGGERYQAVTMMWIMDQQNAITSLYSPEQLRPAWVHKITMTEGTPDEIARNPDNYIEIQTTKDEFK